MKKETTVRPYEARINGNISLIEKTYNIYQQGAELWLNFWLDVLGACEPWFLRNSPVSTFTFADQNVNVPPAILLASFWFSLESKKGAPSRYVLAPEEVMPKFREYYKKPITAAEELFLVHSFLCPKKEAVWVDRRASVQEQCKEKDSPFYGFAANNFSVFFQNSQFVFQGEKEVQGHIFMRSFLSEWWGEAPKDYWLQVENKVQQILKIIKSSNGDEVGAICAKCLKHLGVNVGVPASRVMKILGIPGTPNVLAKRLTSPDQTTKEELIGFAQEMIDRARYRSKGLEMLHKMPQVREYFERRLGVKYYLEKGSLQNQFNEMGGMALRRIKSYLQNFYLQMSIRADYYDFTREAEDVYDRLMLSWLEDFKKQKQDFITENEMNGWRFVWSCWTKSPHDLVSATQEAKKNFPHRRFGSIAFFLFLAKKIQGRLEEANWYQVLLNAHERDRGRWKFSNLKQPNVSHFCDKSDHPWFGESRPSFVVNADGVQTTADDAKVQLNIYDGTCFRDEWFSIRSKRLNKEIFIKTEGVQASRNTKLYRAYHHAASINPIAIVQSMQLRQKEGKWYVTCSVQMEKKKGPKLDDCRTLPLGLRFLSIDLGQRTPGAYSIWQVERKGDFSLDLGGRNISMRLLEEGFISDPQEINVGSMKGRKICRLGDSHDSPATPKQQALLRYLNCLTENKEEVPVGAVATINAILSRGFTYYRALLENKIVMNAEVIEKIRDNMLSVFDRVQMTREVCTVGGLSYRRIKAMQSFRRLCQMVLSEAFMPFVSAKDRQIISKINDFLQKKINAMRKERVRITTSKIMERAIKYGVKLICMEDLNMQSAARYSKFLNRRLDVWCPKKIIKEVNDQAVLFGITVFSINPVFSSHTDWETGEKTVRLLRMKGRNVMIRDLEKRLEFLRLSQDRSELDELYLAAYEDLAKSLNTTLEELPGMISMCPDITIDIPDRTGNKVLCASGTYLDADLNAARVIAVQSLRKLVKKSSPAERKKTKKEEKEETRKALLASLFA